MPQITTSCLAFALLQPKRKIFVASILLARLVATTGIHLFESFTIAAL